MFRRIAAACALLAVVAMGFAAPAEAGFRRDGSAASAPSLDTVLVAASARRGRAREPEIDARPASRRTVPFAPFHPLWLTAALPLQPSPTIADRTAVLAPSRGPSPLALASRTSRGPPPRS